MAHQNKPIPELNERRLAVVERAFNKFDRDGSGVIDINDMRRVYDTSRHPRVLDGTMSTSMVMSVFLNNFEPCAKTRDGRVTWDEFMTFYKKMSQEIDMGREIDRDAYFELVVSRAWRLDEPDEERMEETAFIPIDLEKPTGLRATRNMDLVWKDADGRVVAFKAVVKSLFGRKELPPPLRKHFAYSDELERVGVKYLPTNGSAEAMLDVVWPEEDGTIRGVKSVVTMVVNRDVLPETLRSIILVPRESKNMPVQWISTAPAVNPAFKKSSQAYGVGADDQCKRVLELKKATFEGTACGEVFAGHTGKFSNSFGGGMYRNDGLNVTKMPKIQPF